MKDNIEHLPVEEVITYELREYKKGIIKEQKSTTTTNTEPLLQQIQNHFSKFKENIIYFDIHENKHNYIDEDEIWTESEYTLEITLDSMNHSLLAELERVFGETWELQSTRVGSMRIEFDLVGGNLTQFKEEVTRK